MSVQFDIRVITGNSNSAIDGIIGGLHSATGEANGLTGAFERVGKGAFYLNNIQTAISGVANDFENAVEPGISFNDNLKDLQAITGVTEQKLDEIGASARQNAMDFGIDATKGVESYKLILSQLGPEIAKVPKALNEMGRDAAILSKQMGGDVAGAVEVLNTAMNQYGVSTKDPIEASKTMGVMMNIMSAAAQEGSAEMPQIKAALEQSGMMAKTANVAFNELNASIQVLDKSGKKGAEGGVAIRNALAEMSQGAMNSPKTIAMLHAAGISVDGLADKSKSFAQRLSLLKPIVNDTAAMTQLFGKENVSAGIALVSNVGEIERLTGKITGTSSASEMAATKMESFKEKMARANAWMKDLGISLFHSTEQFIPFIHFGMGGLQVMANLAQASNLFSMIGKARFIPAIVGAVTSMGSWIATTVMATAAQLGLNAAMYANPIGVVVVAVVAAIAAVAALIYYWDEIWGAIKSFTAWMYEHSPFKFLIDVVDKIFPGFKKSMGELWDWVVGKFEALIGWFKKAWDWIKALFGSSKEDSKAAVEDLKKNVDGLKIEGVTVQGKVVADSTLSGYKPGGKKDGAGGKAGKEMSSNISSGGSRPTTIHLTVQKLIGIGEAKVYNIKEGGKEAGNRVVEEILIALQSVNGKLSTN